MRAPRTFIKLIYIGCFAATFVLGFLAGIVGAIDEDLMPIALIIQLLAMLPVIGIFGSVLFWIYDAWDQLPEQWRIPLAFNQPVNPALIVLGFFVPCFNLFWIFATNIALVRHYNALLAQRGSSRQIPEWAPVIAGVLQLVPYCNFVFGPIMWVVFMFLVDAGRTELFERSAGMGVGGPGPGPGMGALPQPQTF